jgi:carboxymethylenebutenolidase
MKKLVPLVLAIGAIILVAVYLGMNGEEVPTNSNDTATSTKESADNGQTSPSPFSEGQYEVTTESVEYYNGVSGYLAKPAEPGEYPGLVLIHEWWGLNQNIKDLAEQYAAQGYVALAVDLYDGEVADTPDQAGELAGAVREDVDTAFANLEGAMGYLTTLESVDASRLASVGWCFGGGWAYEMAANNLGVDASVMYYGRFSAEDDLSNMRADILGHFGEEDRSIAIDDVNEFQAKLDTLEGDHAVYIYPNAGHAFANADNEDAYNEPAARQAWQRTLDFLNENLN